MEEVGIVITARVHSSRIPSKVLQTIGRKRAIDILLDHVINDRYPVILAIPESEDNDILEQIAQERGVFCYRGYDDSPLHRLYFAAKDSGLDHVVRITADDILIELMLMFNQIQMHVKGGHEYTYMRQCIEGSAGEVIKMSALKQVIGEVGERPVEFISYYLKNRFKTFEYYPPDAYKFPYRCVMDYPEDLMFLRVLFACIPEPVTSLDVIHFLRTHKYFTEINKLPTVTIYTCNYNQSKYIEDCMRSVMSQDMTDFEYIIIDDCSTDDSMNKIISVMSEWDDEQRGKVTIYRNRQNVGLPTSCNHVLGIARGRYIIRVDADDTLLPSAIQKMVWRIREDNTQGVISGYNYTDDKLTVTETIGENRWHPGCSMLSRWCVNELKYKDGLKYLEGEEFFSRFKKQYKISFLNEPLWNYRQHAEQKTKQPDHPHNGLTE